MDENQNVSRRVTGAEEAELRAAQDRFTAAERTAAGRQAERDQLLADISDAGGRVSDIADILEMSRAAVYDAIERARGRA